MTRILCGVVLAGLLFFAARAAHGDGERFESARLGVAPSTYRQMEFQGGAASVGADGHGWAEFKYALGNRATRPRRALVLTAHWVEKARGGRQRTLHPKIQVNGSTDGALSTTHQVNMRIQATYAAEFPPSEGIALARRIAQALERRALPRTLYMQTFRPPERLQTYHLTGSNEYHLEDRTGLREVEFKYGMPLQSPRGQWLMPRRKIRLNISWEEHLPVSDPSNHRWEMSESDREAQRRRGSLGAFLVYSRTHKAKVMARGEYWNDTRREWINGFERDDHRALAHSSAMQCLNLAAKHFAKPKAGGSARIVDRPAPDPAPSHASGSITRIRGPVIFVRNGKRVNVVAGGRVAKGDRILVGRNGRVEIRFDNPTSGASGDGTLIAVQGSYTIDVDPVRKKPNVTVTVNEGAARFVRPIVDVPIDVSIAIGSGLFGQLTGTDVVARFDPKTRETTLTVGVGIAKVQVLEHGRIATGHLARRKWNTVPPGWRFRLRRDGTSTLNPLHPIRYDDYVAELDLRRQSSR